MLGTSTSHLKIEVLNLSFLLYASSFSASKQIQINQTSKLADTGQAYFLLNYSAVMDKLNP